MKITIRWFLGVVLALFASSTLVSAHHSDALLDKDKLYTVPGDVTRYAFVNPHVALYWRAPDQKGQTIEWYGSGSSPLQYVKVGWNTKTFHVGEKVLVQGHAARDGKPLMVYLRIYRCSTGEAVPMAGGENEAIRTHVKIIPLSPVRVQALCAEDKLVEGTVE